MYSPIEQFEIFLVFSLSNLSFYLFFIFFSLILFQCNEFLFQKHIEWWYSNFKNLESHIFVLLTIWFLIFFSNLVGMIPFSNTITAQTVIVASISVPTFFAINYVGARIHSWNLFYLLLPTGVPFGLIPLIAFLEGFSYLVRLLSLTLRLFANLLSGHILMKILLYAFISFPLLSILVVPIVFLEFMVALVQAYVFLTLTISYYQDVFLPH